MIRHAKRLLLAGTVLSLAACASAPLHYYTLVAPAGTAASAPAATATTASAPPFQLLPVSVPAAVDQPQLVVREGAQAVAVLGSERWVAPLGDEVRSALSADLARDLHSQDVDGLPDNDKPLLRITLDVRRFDSQPGSYALIEGAWSVRLLHGDHPAVLACSSRIRETVGQGYAALVQGHQQAIGQLAQQMATVARALGDGQAATCPND